MIEMKIITTLDNSVSGHLTGPHHHFLLILYDLEYIVYARDFHVHTKSKVN